MRNTAALIAACMAQPAMAQWGLHGFTDDGLIYEIDQFTGGAVLIGDLGVPTVGVSLYQTWWRNYLELVALTPDDQVIFINLRDLSSRPLMSLTGRPAGYTPVAFEYTNWPSPTYHIMMDSPTGEDVLFHADPTTGEYEMVGATGLSDVVELGWGWLLTESGGVYASTRGQGWVLQHRVNVGEPLRAMSRSECGIVYTGEGAYQGKYSGSVTRIASTGLGHITTLAYSDPWDYGCNLDTSTGVSVCDIFDFLAFLDGWHNGEPFACECSTNTGTGVCDIFDFICFQEAWIQGAHVQGKCH